MIHRREIDGLRAVAVVPVILFHAGFRLFSGGFVGVDVFFVISGYLITSILIGELEQGDFSIAKFYERRARRILPALFFVMFFCIPFAWMWMLPSELKKFSQSIVAVVFFSSNILFWREEGYFASSAELKPLLHTWSLGVEEQYYLLFPIFLFLTWRFGRNRVFWSICLIAAISLAASEWGWRNKPTANFYLAPTRIWELLAGSMCAFWMYGRVKYISNWLSFSGLMLIVFAIFCYDDATPSPSIYTIAPVLGTALIIMYGGAGTWTAKLLSMRGFVGIGLISYSAYLWHQPLFAFARIRSLLGPSPYLMAALAALSLVLAFLSWRYIEKPFRNGQASILPTRRAVLVASASVATVFVAGGFVGNFEDGFAQRGSGGINFKVLDERLVANHGLNDDCDGESIDSANCQTAKKPNVVLWGDSYAMHLAQGIIASDPLVRLKQYTASSCAPIIGISQFNVGKGYAEKWARECIAFNDNALNWIKNNRNIDIVVLSSPFSGVTDGKIFTRDGHIYQSSDNMLVQIALIDTAKAIQALGARVIIVSPTPSSGRNNGLCLARASLVGEMAQICNFRPISNSKPFSLLKSVNYYIPVYWLQDVMCSREMCDATHGGIFLYRDEGHLSKEGSAYLGKNFFWMDRFRALAR